MKEVQEVKAELVNLTEQYKLMKIGTILNLVFEIGFYILTPILLFYYINSVIHEEYWTASAICTDNTPAVDRLFNALKLSKLFLAIFSLTIAVLLSKLRVKRTRIAKILISLTENIERLDQAKKPS
jgi:hypothetical protein